MRSRIPACLHIVPDCWPNFDSTATESEGDVTSVCVWLCVCGHVYVVYEDTNLYNDMGMT